MSSYVHATRSTVGAEPCRRNRRPMPAAKVSPPTRRISKTPCLSSPVVLLEVSGPPPDSSGRRGLGRLSNFEFNVLQVSTKKKKEKVFPRRKKGFNLTSFVLFLWKSNPTFSFLLGSTHVHCWPAGGVPETSWCPRF